MGLAPSSVHNHLSVLQDAGYLTRGPDGRARPWRYAGRWPGRWPADGVEVPLVGRIAAGVPLLAEEMIEDTFWLPRRLVGKGTVFMLWVAGDSMIGAGIADGDPVVVREQPVAENGEIVAAAITTEGEAEATVKILQRVNGHMC